MNENEIKNDNKYIKAAILIVTFMVGYTLGTRRIIITDQRNV